MNSKENNKCIFLHESIFLCCVCVCGHNIIIFLEKMTTCINYLKYTHHKNLFLLLLLLLN